MRSRMSEGFVKAEASDWLGGFGMAPIKSEGAEVYVDTQFPEEEPGPPTAWFERSFTAEECCRLAAILHASGDPLAVDVAQHMTETAKECR